MSFEVTTIRGVRAQYGARKTGYALGAVKTEGGSYELSVDVTGESLNALAYAEFKIPARSIIINAYFETVEAFVLGGTTPAIEIGTSGSEATNGVTITEAQAESVGADDVTAALSGTWAAGAALAAETTVGVAFSGSTPTSTQAGKLRVTIVYKKLGAS